MRWRPNLLFDTSVTTWQRRTLRYLAIYLVLALTLVTARYLTQHIRPALREAQKQESELQTRKDQLEIAVQVATTPQKVQEWALANGMQPFAESNKVSRNLVQNSPPAFPNKLSPSSSVEVRTEWK